MIMRVPSKDKECDDDQRSNNGETEIEETGKNLNRAREAFIE